MESAIGLHKTELTARRGPWRDLAHVEMETAGYLHWSSNRRIHSAIGDVTPAEREAAWTPHAAGKDGKNEKEAACAARIFPEEAAAPGCGRRDGTGPPPPASTVLRIALARDGLRPPLTPETSGGPRGQQSGQPKGLPRSGRGALPAARGGCWRGLTPGTKWRDTGTR